MQIENVHAATHGFESNEPSISSVSNKQLKILGRISHFVDELLPPDQNETLKMEPFKIEDFSSTLEKIIDHILTIDHSDKSYLLKEAFIYLEGRLTEDEKRFEKILDSFLNLNENFLEKSNNQNIIDQLNTQCSQSDNHPFNETLTRYLAYSKYLDLMKEIEFNNQGEIHDISDQTGNKIGRLLN